MKKLTKISFLVVVAIIFCRSLHAQQRASDKSVATIMNEIKQRQALRNRMLPQMRQPAPSNSISQINTSTQTGNNAAGMNTTKHITTGDGTSQQGPNDKPLIKPVTQAPKSGKQ